MIPIYYLIKCDFGNWNPPPLSPNPETIRGRHNTIKQNFMSDLLGSLMKNEWKVLKKNSIVKLLSIWIDLFNVHTCAERKKVLRFDIFSGPLLKSFQHLTSYIACIEIALCKHYLIVNIYQVYEFLYSEHIISTYYV